MERGVRRMHLGSKSKRGDGDVCTGRRGQEGGSRPSSKA